LSSRLWFHFIVRDGAIRFLKTNKRDGYPPR
jgi:hypothetical protein